MDKIGVDIVQPIVPAYRVALFEGLAADENLSISVQASSPFNPDGERSVPLHVADYYPNRPASRLGPFHWQHGLKLIHARRRGDVLVVCGDLTHLSNYLLIVRGRIRSVGVIWWGHHKTAFGKKWKVRIRVLLARWLADVYLCYTEDGARYLKTNGFDSNRVFATGNTVPQAPIVEAIRYWNADRLMAFTAENGLAGKRLLIFSSMLRAKTQLEVLIRAMAMDPLRDAAIVLAVIGDGEMRREYEATAARVGVSNKIRWLGELSDQNAMAPWFLSARAFVYPGAIGLSLLHAFSYGLPVLTHGNADHQMPEFAALIPGENGLLFREGDAADLAVQLARLIESDILCDQLSTCAKKTAREYSMPRMIARFKEAVVACSQMKPL